MTLTAMEMAAIIMATAAMTLAVCALALAFRARLLLKDASRATKEGSALLELADARLAEARALKLAANRDQRHAELVWKLAEGAAWSEEDVNEGGDPRHH